MKKALQVAMFSLFTVIGFNAPSLLSPSPACANWRLSVTGLWHP